MTDEDATPALCSWRRSWAALCGLLALPPVLLVVLAGLIDSQRLICDLVDRGPRRPLGYVVLEVVRGFAVISSGLGGLVASAWEENFPYSKDWGYLWTMAVLSTAQWGVVWHLGCLRNHRLRLFLMVLVPSLCCSFGHVVSLIGRHT